MEYFQRKNYIWKLTIEAHRAGSVTQNCAFVKSLSNYLRLSFRSQYYGRQY